MLTAVARVTFVTCDRCGRKASAHSRAQLLNGAQVVWVSDLCELCLGQLDVFMMPRPQEPAT